MPDKTRILFLCTGNACRSQMAEGWARYLKGDSLDAVSAGIEPQGLDPRPVQVMAEAGVDISEHRSKHFDEVTDGRHFDSVITVCSHADRRCPHFPGNTQLVHHAFDDPAQAQGSDQQVLEVFRRVRDEIRAYVEGLLDPPSRP